MKTFYLVLTVVALANTRVPAQAPPCSGGRCEPRNFSRLEWKQRDDAPGEAYLFIDGVQAGGYHRQRDEWRDYDAGIWSAPRSLGSCWPRDFSFRGVEQATPAGHIRNFGLELQKIQENRDDGYTLGSRPVTAAEAVRCLGGEAFHDDSQLLRLTIIGTPAQRQKVIEDLDRHEALQPWKDRTMVCALAPDSPRIRDAGFASAGVPTIYIQTPEGRVLHRQDEYRGAVPLAEVLQIAERRRKDPNYDPGKDPDLNRLRADSFIHFKTWHLYLGAGILLALLFRRKVT
jgi:hypothetical protein